MNYPFNISNDSIAVFFNGKMYQVSRSDVRFGELREVLLSGDHNPEVLEDLLDIPTKVSRITEGLVEATEDGVTFNGEPVHGSLVDMLVGLIQEGHDATPWARFLDNLMQNPSYRSRNQLYGFLEKHGTPITQDGCFIAFKGVRNDFTDFHTSTFDNRPGQTIVMDRTQVDDDPENTCSSGLHVCATEYLTGGMFSDQKIVVVKINPRDVVSIPRDYNLSKMRVCRYTVLEEVQKEQLDTIWEDSYYDYDPLDDDYEDTWG